jgi:hypothetical protein
VLQAAVKEHYDENESDFNSCPSVNFVNLVDPFKCQLSVTWTYNFSADEVGGTTRPRKHMPQRPLLFNTACNLRRVLTMR